MGKHTGADGLSRQPRVDEDPDSKSDVEEWIDTAYAFTTERIPWDYPTCLVFNLTDPQTPIPQTDKANKRDDELQAIESFLRNLIRPTHMNEQPVVVTT